MITIRNRFDGGLTEDKREKSINKFFLLSNFDTQYANKLRPQFKTEADESGVLGKSNGISKFVFEQYNDGLRLFGLGKTAGGASKVLTYDVQDSFTGGWLDEDAGGARDGQNESGQNTLSGQRTFAWYKNYIYFWNDNGLSRYAANVGVGAFNDDILGVSLTQAPAPGVIHPSDDILYVFYDNKVAKIDGTTPSSDILTGFSSTSLITAACAYGNYLAIAVSDRNPSSSFSERYDLCSKVYLWDRDTSLATLTEVIDFGKGEIIHLANLDGKLTAVVDEFASQTSGISRGRVVVKQRNGLTHREMSYLEVDVNTSDDSVNVFTNLILKSNAIVQDNKMYFGCKPVENSDNRLGIWSVDGNGALALEVVEEDATSIEGIFKLGKIWYIAHSDDGSVQRTDNDSAYSTTQASVIESLINLGDVRLDGGRSKKLVRVGVMTEPLPTAGQIVLKYRTDENIGNGTWASTGTTIFTNATDDSSSHYAINIESTGGALPEFKEIEFRIESTGGAVVTGIYMDSEHIDKDV